MVLRETRVEGKPTACSRMCVVVRETCSTDIERYKAPLCAMGWEEDLGILYPQFRVKRSEKLKKQPAEVEGGGKVWGRMKVEVDGLNARVVVPK